MTKSLETRGARLSGLLDAACCRYWLAGQIEMLISFLVGACASLASGLLLGFAPFLGAAIGLIVIAPLVEEWARATSIESMSKRVATENWVRCGAAHGLGFGLVEAIPRWIDLEGYFSGTLVPLALHVLLSIVFVRMRASILRAFAACVAIHVAHNGYVLLLASVYSAAQLKLDILFRLIVIANAISFLGQSRQQNRAD